MTPAELSALIEELEKMEKQLRDYLRQLAPHVATRAAAKLVGDSADLLSRCRDALRGGVLVPMEPTVEEKKYIVASLLIQLWVTLPAVEPGTMPNYEQAWAIAKSVLDAAPQAGAKEGG